MEELTNQMWRAVFPWRERWTLIKVYLFSWKSLLSRRTHSAPSALFHSKAGIFLLKKKETWKESDQHLQCLQTLSGNTGKFLTGRIEQQKKRDLFVSDFWRGVWMKMRWKKEENMEMSAQTCRVQLRKCGVWKKLWLQVSLRVKLDFKSAR